MEQERRRSWSKGASAAWKPRTPRAKKLDTTVATAMMWVLFIVAAVVNGPRPAIWVLLVVVLLITARNAGDLRRWNQRRRS